jgi:hypothetical protein
MVTLAEVWAMLAKCAPGYVATPHDHSWDVRWRELRYPFLPLGRHGRSRQTGRAEVEVGHVRQMARMFGIFECAAEEIHSLKQ